MDPDRLGAVTDTDRDPWSRDGALESEVVALDGEVFAFDVHRCRYAEMYRALGLADLGTTLSCSRDPLRLVFRRRTP